MSIITHHSVGAGLYLEPVSSVSQDGEIITWATEVDIRLTLSTEWSLWA